MQSSSAVRGALAAAALMGITAMATASNPPALPVHKTRLENGLTILVREDFSAPVVSVQAWCRAGSITEGEQMGAGLSHVLEHMLFKGTTTRGVAQIPQEIERAGGSMNAYTSFEQTVYYIDLPAENWEVAADILVDCMMNATIPADELLKEKEVILREMAMGQDDPRRRSNKLMWATAYTTHPYRHPVIGYRDIYDRITRDEVVAYYKKYYVPNNLTFILVGAVKADAVVAKLRELTRDFKMAPIAPPVIPAEPPQVSTRELHEEAPIQLTHFHLAWHIPAVTHPDVPALDALAIALGQGRSSRLYREIRQNRGLVHTIGAAAYTPGHPGLFVIHGTCDATQRVAAVAAIRDEIARLRVAGIRDEECQKAVKLSLAEHYSRLKTMSGQAADIGYNDFLVGDPTFSEKYLARLRAVSPADVLRVAQTYLTDENLTITSLNPTGALAAAAAATPTATAGGIQKFEFPNGLRLLVREDRKLPFVDVVAVCKGGVYAETPEQNGVSKLTARMLLKGTTTRTAEQIAELTESVGASLNTFAGNNSFGVSGHAMAEDLDLILDLFTDVLLRPSFPSDNLERERAVQLSELRAEQDQVLRACQQVLREALYQRHPYRLNVLGRPETVAKLQRDDLVAFHRRYVVPDNMVISVFGDVNAQEIRRKIEERFGALPAQRPVIETGGPERLPAPVTRTEHKPKEQAVLLIGFSGATLYDDDRYALELINEVYSGLGSRLFVRLRDELGLCYYTGAYQLIGLEPGYFAFYVGTTDDKVELCRQEIFQELDKLQRDGFTAEELDRAKASLIGQRKVRLQDNGEFAMSTALDELYGLGYNHYLTVDTRYRNVTLADIQQVAQRYFANRPSAVAVIRPSPKGS